MYGARTIEPGDREAPPSLRLGTIVLGMEYGDEFRARDAGAIRAPRQTKVSSVQLPSRMSDERGGGERRPVCEERHVYAHKQETGKRSHD